MGIITAYPDDDATTDSDKFLTSDASGETRLTPASTLFNYILADGNVTTAKLADGAVTGDKVSTYKVVRDNNGTVTTETGAKILTGWGWMQIGGTAASSISEIVTFDSAFTNKPIVIISSGGDAGNVAAVLGTGDNNIQAVHSAKALGVTTTTFKAFVSSPSTFPAASTIYYHWIAIGV